MPAKIKLRDKVYQVEAGITIREALIRLGIPLASVLITRNEELLNEDELLKEQDVIRLVRVISGGE